MLVFAASLIAQKPVAPPKAAVEVESRDLQSALSETSNTPSEIIRTLERHLEKYPNSSQLDEIDRTITRSAMDSGDRERTIKYGERTLARNQDQPIILERVAQLLLDSESDKEAATRALNYAKKFEDILRTLEKNGTSAQRNKGQLLEELDRAIGRALTIQARATGRLGQVEQAITLAGKALEHYASPVSYRERAHWLVKAGRNDDAVRSWAAAFMASDSKSGESDRAKDRAAMAELYKKQHNGSEAGLGDIVLQAYDSAVAFTLKRTQIQKDRDPNSIARTALDFTLAAVEGEPLKLASLKGKVLVLDFWATWCGPCRVQHPLYEQVRERFKDRDDVVLLNINTDEERERVKPFLDENSWSRKVYFDDGLGGFLKIAQIPTTVIIDRKGEIYTRMVGFVPERFVEQLSDRIQDALKVN